MDRYSVNILKDLKYDTIWVIHLGFYVYDLNKNRKSEGKWFHIRYLVLVIQKIMRSGFTKKIIRKYLCNIYSCYIYIIISIMHQQRPNNRIHIWGVKTWYYKVIKGGSDSNIICGRPTVWYYTLIIKTTLFDTLFDFLGSVFWIVQFMLMFKHQKIIICVV